MASSYQTSRTSGEALQLLSSPSYNTSRTNKNKLWLGLLVVVALVSYASGWAVSSRSTTTAKDTTNTLSLELEGKKHKQDSVCNDGKYSKRTLQLAYEMPFAALFQNHLGQRKYEASSVILVNNTAYAVCDSSWALSQFQIGLTPLAGHHIGQVHREPQDSGYEALVYDDNHFYVVRESVLHTTDQTYHAIIEQVQITDQDDYTIVDQSSTEFAFEGDSKGFEGAVGLHDTNNNLILLGLCEGNHCSETRKNDVGHGRVVVMRQNGTVWETLRTIHIPKSAAFRDYSAMSVSPTGKVAITSQEESQMWVGTLLGQVGGVWDVDALAFDEEYFQVYDFPKDHNCMTVYCNIEGITWINDDMVLAVSDKMKGQGKQDFRCFDKDQSAHVFVLP